MLWCSYVITAKLKIYRKKKTSQTTFFALSELVKTHSNDIGTLKPKRYKLEENLKQFDAKFKSL